MKKLLTLMEAFESMIHYQVKLFGGDWMTVNYTVYSVWFGRKRIVKI